MDAVLTAETRVPTERASRYLVQLCEHLQLLGIGSHHQAGDHSGGPPEIRHVKWTDERGAVRFVDGQFTLDATADALSIRIEASNPAALERLKTLFAKRLETIGRRDQLAVVW